MRGVMRAGPCGETVASPAGAGGLLPGGRERGELGLDDDPLVGVAVVLDAVGHAAAASGQDCKDAIDAAAKAFDSWEASSVMQRMAIIQKASQLLTSDEYRAKAVQAMHDEISATNEVCFFNIDYAAMVVLIASGKIHLLRGETLPATAPGGHCVVQRRAKGVV